MKKPSHPYVRLTTDHGNIGKQRSEEYKARVANTLKEFNAARPVWQHARARQCRSAWAKAEQFYQLWKEDSWGYVKFCNQRHNRENVRSFYKMLMMFRQGWIPSQDSDWVEDFQ